MYECLVCMYVYECAWEGQHHFFLNSFPACVINLCVCVPMCSCVLLWTFVPYTEGARVGQRTALVASPLAPYLVESLVAGLCIARSAGLMVSGVLYLPSCFRSTEVTNILYCM